MAGLLQRLLPSAGRLARAGVGSAAGGALGYYSAPEGASQDAQLDRTGIGALLGAAAGGVSPGVAGLKSFSRGLGQRLGFGRPAGLPGWQTEHFTRPLRGTGDSAIAVPKVDQVIDRLGTRWAQKLPSSPMLAYKKDVQLDRLHSDGPFARHGHMLTPLASFASNVAIDEGYGDPTETGLSNAQHNALTMAPLGHLGASIAVSGGGRRKLPMFASATSLVHPLLNYLARRQAAQQAVPE